MKKNIINSLISIFKYTPNNSYAFSLPESQKEQTSIISESSSSFSGEDIVANIMSDLNSNLDFLKVKYNILINSDIVLRQFTLTASNKEFKAFLIYIDGMIDSKMINDFVLKPLMLHNLSNTRTNETKRITSIPVSKNISIKKIKKFKIDDYIYNSLIPQNTITKETKFSKIISEINSGNCALFIDSIPVAFNIEVKGFQTRAVAEPNNEIVVHGAQEAFVENIRTNTSLLRRIVNNENLVIESTSVGSITRTKIAICYMKNIANDELVSEVKFRINNLNIDSLVSSGQLDQLIQDNDEIADPQIISTERPDKAANHVLEGRVVIIVNGSPYVLIVPGLLVDFLSSPEDMNLKHQFANLLKIIRLISAFFALLLPGIYIAITNYHQELIPTELLFAISASRQTVPFPVFFEIILMEISFELIREAGLRVPSPMGSTIGIVGALILGEAAVNANIVSPILIIIVAITGICSFAIPDFSLGFSLRLWRFFYIFAGYFFGFLGIGFGLFVNFVVLLDLNSFGVPYFSPYIPVSNGDAEASLFLLPIWKRENRPDFLNTKRTKTQGKISIKWKST